MRFEKQTVSDPSATMPFGWPSSETMPIVQKDSGIDHHYSMRWEDLCASRGERQYELDDIMLLKVGRHIRPAENFKVIIAREEGEGNFLRGYRKQYPSLDIISHHGPFALLDGDPAPEDVKLAASIIGRYSQGRNADEITLEYSTPEGDVREIRVLPLKVDDVPDDWLF